VEGCILHLVFVHSINALSKLYLISARPPQNGQGLIKFTLTTPLHIHSNSFHILTWSFHAFLFISLILTSFLSFITKDSISWWENFLISFLLFLFILFSSCISIIIFP